jgi:hypothetical protein
LNIARSTTGTLASRVLSRNRPIPAMAAAQQAMTLPSPHPQSGPFRSPSETAPRPTINSMLPIRSGMRVSWLCLIFGTQRAAAITVAIPIGRLTTKIQRQLAAVRRPPSTGPIAPEIALLTVQIRTPRRTRSPGSATRISPRLAGTRIAPPAACTQRNATNDHRFGLTAQHRLATVNSDTPIRKLRLRP